MDTIRPGYKTSEFWVSIVAKLFILALTVLIIKSANPDAMAKTIAEIVGAVSLIASQSVYTRSRTKVKRSVIKANKSPTGGK